MSCRFRLKCCGYGGWGSGFKGLGLKVGDTGVETYPKHLKPTGRGSTTARLMPLQSPPMA